MATARWVLLLRMPVTLIRSLSSWVSSDGYFIVTDIDSTSRATTYLAAMYKLKQGNCLVQWGPHVIPNLDIRVSSARCQQPRIKCQFMDTGKVSTRSKHQLGFFFWLEHGLLVMTKTKVLDIVRLWIFAHSDLLVTITCHHIFFVWGQRLRINQTRLFLWWQLDKPNLWPWTHVQEWGFLYPLRCQPEILIVARYPRPTCYRSASLLVNIAKLVCDQKVWSILGETNRVGALGQIPFQILVHRYILIVVGESNVYHCPVQVQLVVSHSLTTFASSEVKNPLPDGLKHAVKIFVAWHWSWGMVIKSDVSLSQRSVWVEAITIPFLRLQEHD
jgi:hypothetical protein